MHAFYFDVK